ncbi:hypothetical protein [Nonomuraea sp. NPDC001023]|uniref:hypothetical protein n=1 Tax=unclassified Nonomuraea TaxID=2593643 RepID=UPI0033197991
MSDDLRAEIARLRAGEADTPAEEGTTPTPAQWIRMWNDGTAEQRLKWASIVLANSEQAARCFQMDHEGRLADVDPLLRALQHPRLLLSGDENGGVGLHCRDHFDAGRPLAYYGDAHPDPEMTTVQTIPSLWAEAVKHLSTAHTVDTQSEKSGSESSNSRA